MKKYLLSAVVFLSMTGFSMAQGYHPHHHGHHHHHHGHHGAHHSHH